MIFAQGGVSATQRPLPLTTDVYYQHCKLTPSKERHQSSAEPTRTRQGTNTFLPQQALQTYCKLAASTGGVTRLDNPTLLVGLQTGHLLEALRGLVYSYDLLVSPG